MPGPAVLLTRGRRCLMPLGSVCFIHVVLFSCWVRRSQGSFFRSDCKGRMFRARKRTAQISERIESDSAVCGRRCSDICGKRIIFS
jgi:hypothetical protein